MSGLRQAPEIGRVVAHSCDMDRVVELLRSIASLDVLCEKIEPLLDEFCTALILTGLRNSSWSCEPAFPKPAGTRMHAGQRPRPVSILLQRTANLAFSFTDTVHVLVQYAVWYISESSDISNTLKSDFIS